MTGCSTPSGDDELQFSTEVHASPRGTAPVKRTKPPADERRAISNKRSLSRPERRVPEVALPRTDGRVTEYTGTKVVLSGRVTDVSQNTRVPRLF